MNLKELYLQNNNIEDISVFDDGNIYFHGLYSLDLRDNPIKKGLEVLTKYFFQKCLSIIFDLEPIKNKIFIQFNSPDYYIDLFVDNFKEIANTFPKEKINFDNLSENISKILVEILNLTPDECYHIKKNKEQNSLKYYDIYDILDFCEKPIIIIDNGTSYTKAGFNNTEGPTIVFPTCIGNNEFIGTEEEAKRKNIYELKYPIEQSKIKDWEDMEKIWDIIYLPKN